MRQFGWFGFNLPFESRVNPVGTSVAEKLDEWLFVPHFYDWPNTENELTLTAYNSSHELLNPLQYKIRCDIE